MYLNVGLIRLKCLNLLPHFRRKKPSIIQLTVCISLVEDCIVCTAKHMCPQLYTCATYYAIGMTELLLVLCNSHVSSGRYLVQVRNFVLSILSLSRTHYSVNCAWCYRNQITKCQRYPLPSFKELLNEYVHCASVFAHWSECGQTMRFN